MKNKGSFLKLEDLYVAYRKAKVQAYYENTHSHSIEFTEYEQDLEKNLLNLYFVLTKKDATWPTDLKFIGDYAYLPKSLDLSVWDDKGNGHFCSLDPLEQWQTLFDQTKKKPAAKLRLIIRPTVNYQIISALWLIKVGHKFDGILERNISYGNRLRRHAKKEFSTINLEARGLFEPYFSAYRDWREKGLASMERALKDNSSILAITMDVKQFYHNVSPEFLLRKTFLEKFELVLSKSERAFTKALLKSIDTWYKSTPDYKSRPEGGLPVGLSASSVIANVLLAEFDNEVISVINPLYYGRYVDDVFLVFANEKSPNNSSRVIHELASRLPSLEVIGGNTSHSLKLNLLYAQDSYIEFSGEKQKIFSLSSEHGLDLILQIRNQIRVQSSEYRLLPEVPATGPEMAAKTLLAAPDASLQVDALRKADAISIKRLGFSLLLRDLEAYSADLEPSSWKTLRHEFYKLANRYVITPYGFFDFVIFIPRIFGLMLSNGDIQLASKLIDDLSNLSKLLIRTTQLGEGTQSSQFELCIGQYALALRQAGLHAGTEFEAKLDLKFLRVLKKLKELDPSIKIPRTLNALRKMVHQILLADWGKRPYKDYWLHQQKAVEDGPKIPKSFRVRRQLRLGAVKKFREEQTDLVRPHWPALAFPTRPLSIDEIALVAPRLLEDSEKFKLVINVLRGAKVISEEKLGISKEGNLAKFNVPQKPFDDVRVALTSIETTEIQWNAAAQGRPDYSYKRYLNLFHLINRILKETKQPDYIVLPELAIPERWAIRIARKLAANGISLIAGIEYHTDRKRSLLRNDCLLSLTTIWPGYPSHIIRYQPKFKPADEEKSTLSKLKLKLYEPKGIDELPTIYEHGQFVFSVLICSDLTNISNRNILRGYIDSLYVLEWNRDVNTFSSLVEATAADLHSYLIQANNRKYGDSRIRAPYKENYQRDVVRLKGGISDYYVLGQINYKELRQSQRRKKTNSKFKPVPIGYRMSRTRFNMG